MPGNVRDYSGGNSGPGNGAVASRWWDEEDRGNAVEVGEAMVATAKAIEASPSEQLRYDLNLLYGSLYEGRELSNLYQYGGQATVNGTNLGSVGGDITWNVIRSVVQTVASQVSRSRPRARFVTTMGNYRQKRRAKKLTQFCDGIFTEAKVYEKTQQAFIQAGAFDVVGIHVHREFDRPAVDLVRACEIMIDANDGIDGKQRSLYRRKYIDRGVLLAAFGKGNEERRNAIKTAQTADPVAEGGRTNLVEVYESWHLRSGKTATDGKHCIAIPGAGGTLLVEDYKRDHFPIILFSIDPALSGPYGRSPAEILLPIQVAVNTGLDKIAKAQHLVSVPRVWMPIGAKVAKAQMSNAIGGMNYYAGNTPPTFYSPVALQAEVYQQLERHFEKGFSLYGVSAQVAAGQKEAGVTAAVAIRESLDIQTARFALLSQRWEALHMEVARMVIEVAREIYASDHDMVVMAPGTALLESIDWKDVNLEEDQFVIQPYPTSLLPTTPQGRIDRVVELVSEGIWTAERGEAALDDLDPDSHQALDRAAEQNIERILENMLIDGKYEGPEPYFDLTSCLKLAVQYANEGQLDGAPEKHVDLVYRWMDDTAALQAMIKPAPAPLPMAPAAAPMQMAA